MRRYLPWIGATATFILVILLIARFMSPRKTQEEAFKQTSGPPSAISAQQTDSDQKKPASRRNFLRGSDVRIEYVGEEDARKPPEVIGKPVSTFSGSFIPGPPATQLVYRPRIALIVHPLGTQDWYVHPSVEAEETDEWTVRNVNMGTYPHHGGLFEVWAMAAYPPVPATSDKPLQHPPWDDPPQHWTLSQRHVLVRVQYGPTTPPGWKQAELRITQIGERKAEPTASLPTVESLPVTSVSGTYRGPENVRISLMVRPERARRWIPVARNIKIEDVNRGMQAPTSEQQSGSDSSNTAAMEGEKDTRVWEAPDVNIPEAAQPGSRNFEFRAVATTIPILADEIEQDTLQELHPIYSNIVPVTTLGWYPPAVSILAVKQVTSKENEPRWKIFGSARDLPEGGVLQLLTCVDDSPWYWPQQTITPNNAGKWDQKVAYPPSAEEVPPSRSVPSKNFNVVAAVLLHPLPIESPIDRAGWQNRAVIWEVQPVAADKVHPSAQARESLPAPKGAAFESERLTITKIAGKPVSEDHITEVDARGIVECDPIAVPSKASLWIARRCLEGGGWSVVRRRALRSEAGWTTEEIEFGDLLPGRSLLFEVRAFVWPTPTPPHDPDLPDDFAHALHLSPSVRVRVIAPVVTGNKTDTQGGVMSVNWPLILTVLGIVLVLMILLFLTAFLVMRRASDAIGRLSRSAARELEETWPKMRPSMTNTLLGLIVLLVMVSMLVWFYPFYSLVLSRSLGISPSYGGHWALFLMGATAVAGILLHWQAPRETRDASLSPLVGSDGGKDEAGGNVVQSTLVEAAPADSGDGKDEAAVPQTPTVNRTEDTPDRESDPLLPYLVAMTAFLWMFQGAMLGMFLYKATSTPVIVAGGFFGGIFASFIETMAFRRIAGWIFPDLLVWPPMLAASFLRVVNDYVSVGSKSLQIQRVDGTGVGPGMIGAKRQTKVEGILAYLPQNIPVWLVIKKPGGIKEGKQCQITAGIWEVEVLLGEDADQGKIFELQAVASWADPLTNQQGAPRPLAVSQIVLTVRQ